MQRGAGASLEEVAKRAGVGIGTLYRRFPSREALLAAAWNAHLLSFAQSSRAKEDEPLNAMRAFLEKLVLYTQIYQGLAASLGTVLQSGTPGCRALSEEGSRLLLRGQQAGVLRSDISFEDIVFVTTAISLATEHDSDPEPRIAHLVDLFLHGLSVAGRE